jgi:hypothetical protein
MLPLSHQRPPSADVDLALSAAQAIDLRQQGVYIVIIDNLTWRFQANCST